MMPFLIADLFTIPLRNDDVEEFDTRWDQQILTMGNIPTYDVLESLYKLSKSEYDQLKTYIGIVYSCNS